MGLSVWADGPDAQGIVCSDARLRDHEGFHPFGAPVTTHDQVYGQAGWDVGVVFTSLHDLADKLVRLRVPDFLPGAGRTIRHGELTRLAIVCHGAPGELFINGLNHQRESLTPERIYGRPHQPDLQRIGLLTPNDGTGVIYFMSCNAGQGTAGTNLLVALSRAFPNRRVVAFATPGYQPAGRMLRTGEGCS